MYTYKRFPVNFIKGKGVYLYDDKGEEYLDFVSGIAVNCLGHSHPKIVDCIKNQAENLIHISNYYWNKEQIDLAEILCENSPFEKAFFCSSGTEAVEAALKLAKKYSVDKPEKSKIIYMNNSFHGRSMGALSVTGQPKYQESFKPLIAGATSIDFNDTEALEAVFDENVCALIMEPIQGEGGIIPASTEFINKARELCDQYDSILIFDEVQCGIGRSGKLFCFDNFNVTPDVVCLAKGLGGGVPIGAMLATEKCSDALQPGDHGTTFGGNPLVCAVGNTVINELVNEGVISGVTEKSNYLKDKLNLLVEKYDSLDSVRGMGLLIGVIVNADPKEVMQKCFDNKLLLVSAGKNVLRFLPPLNVTKEEIDKAVSIFEDSIKSL